MTKVAYTSTKMYAKLKSEGIIGNQHTIIIRCLNGASWTLTRREISKITGIEPGAVAGRVNELIKTGKLTERGKRICKITGRLAKLVRLYEP